MITVRLQAKQVGFCAVTWEISMAVCAGATLPVLLTQSRRDR